MPADEDKMIEGIYEIEKSMLKICLTMNPGDGRQSECATKDGKAYVMITLEKQK